MRSLKDILNSKSISASPLIKGIRASQIITAAENVLAKMFGPEIKDHAAPAYFKNQTLAIACLSTTVAQEIKINEAEFIKKINSLVPGANVLKIKYLT